MDAQVPLRVLARHFLGLGCIAFGGPVAHLAHFRTRFVEEEGWMDDNTFADLVALCQSLPGPSSSQTGFAIGVLQRGWFGGLVAWSFFILPSALLMAGLAVGMSTLTNLNLTLLHGVAVAALAVILNAMFGLAARLTPDGTTRALAVVGAATLLLVPWLLPALTPLATLIAVMLCGSIGWRLGAGPGERGGRVACSTVGPVASRAALLLFLSAAFLPGLLQAAGVGGGLDPAAGLLRSGAFVFGGGHVVLPLLQAEVVDTGLVDHATFLAGYGAANAVPGPMFSFGAFLGGVIQAPGWPTTTVGGTGGVLLGCFLGVVALNLPGLAVVVACLPFWEGVRHRPEVRSTLRGINAGVVGLLGAAFVLAVAAVGSMSLERGWAWLLVDVAIAAGCVALLRGQRAPAWAVVLGAGAVVALLNVVLG
jgi:chromate transporter